jgi:hypothetical protein
MTSKQIESSDTTVVGCDRLAIDCAGRQPGHRLYDEWEAFAQIVPQSVVEPHPLAILAGNDAATVVLDLMQPVWAGRRARGPHGQARRDEARRQCKVAAARGRGARGQMRAGHDPEMIAWNGASMVAPIYHSKRGAIEWPREGRLNRSGPEL